MGGGRLRTRSVGGWWARRKIVTIRLPITRLTWPCGCCELIFFFQAEDGIRDYKVTGVQTCALPIYRILPWLASAAAARSFNPAARTQCWGDFQSFPRQGKTGLILCQELRR